MKKDKIIFWTTTGIVAAMMLFSAFGYFTNPEMKEAFVHLGFPDYFRLELGTAKIIGAIVLLLPMIPKGIKQFAYFGFFITLVSAAIAHAAVGDPISNSIVPLVILGIVSISYKYYLKLN